MAETRKCSLASDNCKLAGSKGEKGEQGEREI